MDMFWPAFPVMQPLLLEGVGHRPFPSEVEALRILIPGQGSREAESCYASSQVFTTNRILGDMHS